MDKKRHDSHTGLYVYDGSQLVSEEECSRIRCREEQNTLNVHLSNSSKPGYRLSHGSLKAAQPLIGQPNCTSQVHLSLPRGDVSY